MKRERRHELQHNDLAEWILKGYERIVPYRNSILGGGLLLVVLVIALTVWHGYSVAQTGEAWNALGTPVFQPVLRRYRRSISCRTPLRPIPARPRPNGPAVFAGDTALTFGTNKILTDRKGGLNDLTQARDLYAEALKTLTIPAAKEQAMFGKARAIESMIQNKAQLDEAIAAYKELNQDFPHGMFKALAEQQVKQLEKPETLAFYENLAQYAPKAKVESPHSQLENLGELPVPANPPDELPAPVRPGGSQFGPALGIPAPSLKPVLQPAEPDTPKTDTSKTEPAKTQAAKPDAPNAEPPKSETPKPDAPKAEPPKSETPKPDAPKAELPKTEAPKADAPKAEPPKSETPKPEAAKKDK